MQTVFNIRSAIAGMAMYFMTMGVSAIPIGNFGHYPFEGDQELYNTIVELDRIFFAAYNNCDLEKQASLISEDLEFYHDQGGLSTSKEEILYALKNNICGKVTRELVKGSIEVYEIPGYGAVQMGKHRFYNSEEPHALSKPSKFVTIWKRQDDQWLITRVISLH